MDESVSLLQEAVLAARANVVNDLLEKGGDLEARDQDGNTPHRIRVSVIRREIYQC